MAQDRFPLNPVAINLLDNDPAHTQGHIDERTRLNQLSDWLSSSSGYAPWDLWGLATDSDQTKLEAYTAYAKAKQDAGSPIATCLGGLKEYSVSRTILDIPRGWKIDGCGHGMNHQKSTATDSYSTRVKSVIPVTNGVGIWIDTTAGRTNWNNYFGNICFYDDARTTRWFNTPGVAQFREGTWLNTTFQNGQSVWGAASVPFRMTFCSIRGDQNVFNTAATSFNFAGSDCVGGIFADGVDHYMPGASISGQADPGQAWAGMFSSLGKSWIGAVYGTYFGNWRGLLFTGAETVFGTDILGGVWEGNNENEACDGSVARFEGGTYSLFGTTIDDGMANPSLTANKASNGAQADRALVEVLGATTNVEMFGVHFAHGNDDAGNALPLTTPVVWASKKAKLGMHGVTTGKRNTAWAGALPVVGASVSAAAGDGLAPTWVHRDYSTTNGPGVGPIEKTITLSDGTTATVLLGGNGLAA